MFSLPLCDVNWCAAAPVMLTCVCVWPGPDVRPLEGQGSSDPKGEMTKLNIFQRTRQGKKVAVGAPSAILSEDR